MEERRGLDPIGAAALTGFAALLAFNQVVIKITAAGIAPLLQAGLRSAGAILVVLLWIRLKRVPLRLPREAWVWGVLSGCFFAYEFICLYIALDLTTVARASILFYSMPVWLALAAHVLLPGERLTPLRILGLSLAMLGVVLALAVRSNGQASLLGDVLALVGCFGWAGIALLVRATPLSRVQPVIQLLCQVAVSAPILLVAAVFMGDYFRDPQPIHWLGLAFQTVGVASLGFLAWFGLLKIYRANTVASFSFLSPVFAVIFGWLILGENIALSVWIALALVATGITLINRN